VEERVPRAPLQRVSRVASAVGAGVRRRRCSAWSGTGAEDAVAGAVATPPTAGRWAPPPRAAIQVWMRPLQER